MSGRSTTNPDGWISGSGFGLGRDGLENTNSGTYSTPFGMQAACIWQDHSYMTTAESLFDDALVAGLTYTVSCNVAKPDDLPGEFNIQLVAFDPLDRRSQGVGTVLAQTNGVATLRDMSEAVQFSYTTDAADPNIGRQLAVRFRSRTRCVIDNLSLSDSNAGGDVYPPVLFYRYPKQGAATMAPGYPLILSFSEAVAKGTGSITLKRSDDAGVVETIDVSSDQVAISSNVVTITRDSELAHDTAYYVLIDPPAFLDLAGNQAYGITNNAGWQFRTPISDGSNIIYHNSFERPEVSSRVTTNPDGWRDVSYGHGGARGGLDNSTNGTFTTPFGAQAAWVNSRLDGLVSQEDEFGYTLVSELTYRVTFNVGNTSPGASIPGDWSAHYRVELVAFDPLDARSGNSGTVLQSIDGTASVSDVAAQADGFSFTPDDSHAHLLGLQLAVRLTSSDSPSMMVIDNLTVSDSNVQGDIYPPSLFYRYPRKGATTMAVDYPLLMTFSEAVTNGTGSITVRRQDDDGTVETIDVASGQVTFASNVVTITRNIALMHDAAYYVTMDGSAFADLAGNPSYGITNSADWQFATPITDDTNVIYRTSFETPVVSSRSRTNPDGWVAVRLAHGGGVAGIDTATNATFSTPFGVQAIWLSRSIDGLASEEGAFRHTLASGITYTVTFNVGNSYPEATSPHDWSSHYKVELVAYDALDSRSADSGTVLHSIQDHATLSDMAAQADGFSFKPDASHNELLGKQLGVRIKTSDSPSMMLIDNLTVSDSNTAGDIYPPALLYRYPRNGATTMAPDYPLLMTFSENVARGTGQITVKRYEDDVAVETVDVLSGQVSVSSTATLEFADADFDGGLSNVVRVALSRPLDHGTDYYVTIDNAAFTDSADNAYSGIYSNSGWQFSTVIPDGPVPLHVEDFESPVVSGRTQTAPAGWIRVRHGHGGPQAGLHNEADGLFSTPFGSQAAWSYSLNLSSLVTASNLFDVALEPERVYTVTFAVGRARDWLTAPYTVSLEAIEVGADRTSPATGTVLAQVSGSAIMPDMSAQADGFSFMADEQNPHLAKPLAIRVKSPGYGLVDNVKLTWVPPPPAGAVFIIR